jgi:hypothetical protein
MFGRIERQKSSTLSLKGQGESGQEPDLRNLWLFSLCSMDVLYHGLGQPFKPGKPLLVFLDLLALAPAEAFEPAERGPAGAFPDHPAQVAPDRQPGFRQGGGKSLDEPQRVGKDRSVKHFGIAGRQQTLQVPAPGAKGGFERVFEKLSPLAKQGSSAPIREP